ncbi:hypothetical protein [Pseudonocardia zijingensis]|uniref:LexA-binding, inner membrane-associated hydrolase n=1 Tax=Pseudonocardia zijingensis TaxID=153376 RepID=A0ABN1N8X0_9PSEU
MPDRAATFAATLAALLVGHTVGDHLVQTDHQAARKAASWRAMAGHVAGYQATCAATLAAVHALTGSRPSWRRVIAGHAFSAATHALIDRRWPVTWILEHTGSRAFAASKTVQIPSGMVRPGAIFGEQFTHHSPAPLPLHGPYLADQALHHACLLVAALIITGGRR